MAVHIFAVCSFVTAFCAFVFFALLRIRLTGSKGAEASGLGTRAALFEGGSVAGGVGAGVGIARGLLKIEEQEVKCGGLLVHFGIPTPGGITCLLFP